MDSISLKFAQLLEQRCLHMATDAGKELIKKIGLVYQLNIAPKKLGVDEEIFVGEVTKGEARCYLFLHDNDFLGIARSKTNL